MATTEGKAGLEANKLSSERSINFSWKGSKKLSKGRVTRWVTWAPLTSCVDLLRDPGRREDEEKWEKGKGKITNSMVNKLFQNVIFDKHICVYLYMHVPEVPRRGVS